MRAPLPPHPLTSASICPAVSRLGCRPQVVPRCKDAFPYAGRLSAAAGPSPVRDCPRRLFAQLPRHDRAFSRAGLPLGTRMPVGVPAFRRAFSAFPPPLFPCGAGRVAVEMRFEQGAYHDYSTPQGAHPVSAGLAGRLYGERGRRPAVRHFRFRGPRSEGLP